MSTAAKALSAGQWEQTVESEGTKELGQLANSFKRMVTQLKQSSTTLEVQNTDMRRLNASLI